MESVQLLAIDKNETYSEKVYRQLKQLIVTNQIKPGEALNERELADSLAVSRTPIRDALRTLEQEGWIAKKGKQKVISLLTCKTVQELLEIRLPLELMSYDLAIKKITEQDIEMLQNLTDEMRVTTKAIDPAEYYELMTKDIEVHIQIARISKNTKVIQMISDLGDQLIRTSVLSLQYGDLPIEEYPSRHMRLLECLRKKDYDVGRETLKEHIATWESHLKKIPNILRVDHEENLIF